jgi:predicted nucleic acid-binding protein
VILVDANAWVAHARRADLGLVRLLVENRVVACDVVTGELMLGSGLPKTLTGDLARLPTIPSPTAGETRRFVERHFRIFAASGVG